MKKITLLLSILFVFSAFNSAEAQIWKKIQKKSEKKIEQKAEEKIDEILEEKEEEQIPEKQQEEEEQKQEEQKQEEKESPNSDNKNPETNTSNASEQKSPEIWRNYKFIPGENVIFYDDLKFEEVGEFPSRWDLVKGGAEVAQFNKEKVIITTGEYSNSIIPFFETKDYLTNEFTIEFDIYVEGSKSSNFWTEITIDLTEKTLNSASNQDLRLLLSNGKNTTGTVIGTDFPIEKVALGELNTWHHIALSFHKGKFKLYYDEKRIVNLPRISITPTVFGLGFRGYASGKGNTLNSGIKNIRIAHGGGQMYKRITADGKYVTNGILFDSGKAIIKSQSMGILNKVVTVMNENPDWKFLIIGHTDSDGPEEGNLTLSKARAEAVKQSLITLGIKADRLLTEGKGESQPINQNASPEEKANNRRVEFIKQ